MHWSTNRFITRVRWSNIVLFSFLLNSIRRIDSCYKAGSCGPSLPGTELKLDHDPVYLRQLLLLFEWRLILDSWPTWRGWDLLSRASHYDGVIDCRQHSIIFILFNFQNKYSYLKSEDKTREAIDSNGWLHRQFLFDFDTLLKFSNFQFSI